MTFLKYVAFCCVFVLSACSSNVQKGERSSHSDGVDSETSSDLKGNQIGSEKTEEGPGEYRVTEDSVKVTPIPNDFPQLEKAGFSHYTSVFGIPVIGTEDVTEETMLHVRGVLAGYLDNDQDGVADNPRVVS